MAWSHGDQPTDSACCLQGGTGTAWQGGNPVPWGPGSGCIALSQDNAPPGMTPLVWCQAQSKDPAIHQIIDGIQNKTIGKLKINGDMPSELKALIRLKRQLVLNQGVLTEGPHKSIQKTNSN